MISSAINEVTRKNIIHLHRCHWPYSLGYQSIGTIPDLLKCWLISWERSPQQFLAQQEALLPKFHFDKTLVLSNHMSTNEMESLICFAEKLAPLHLGPKHAIEQGAHQHIRSPLPCQ